MIKRAFGVVFVYKLDGKDYIKDVLPEKERTIKFLYFLLVRPE